MESLQAWGIQLIQSIQVLSPALDSIMEVFTFLGTVNFYILFITFIYWVVDARLGFRVFMLLMTIDVFGSALKQLLHQPRPYWIGDVKQMSIELNYGIPSTHASNTLSVWGYLAFQLKKRWLWILAIFLVLLIGISRLYLGVHFPHDVVGGWLIGLLVLILFVKYEDKIANWFNQKSLGSQVGFGFVLSLLFILVGVAVNTITASTPDPESWAHLSTESRSLSHYFTLAGALFGAIAGHALITAKGNFQTPGPRVQKLGRYLIGIFGLFIILFGLDALFGKIAVDESMLGFILRYIRYGATTFWAMFGAPWVFIKLKLAKQN
ncbi:MAG: phosphatase PAP2 family protein [Anaerolineae bacterium]|nr:phosphatase PAP2 family protein [Anaerolineae bacterium]